MVNGFEVDFYWPDLPLIVEPDGRVVVESTPTYSGCPAMDAIRADIETAVHESVPGRPVVVYRIFRTLSRS